MDEVEVPNQHAMPPLALETTTEKTIRVSLEDLISLGAEVRLGRETITHLQRIGTAQLTASRAACFEMAAMVCEQVSERLDANDSVSHGALECAKAIRELATRGSAS